MLKESRIVSAGSQNYIYTVCVDIIKHLFEHLAVRAVVKDGITLKGIWACPAAKLTGNHRIRRPGRYTQIILKHIPFHILALNKVNARNVVKYVLWRSYALARRQETYRVLFRLL